MLKRKNNKIFNNKDKFSINKIISYILCLLLIFSILIPVLQILYALFLH